MGYPCSWLLSLYVAFGLMACLVGIVGLVDLVDLVTLIYSCLRVSVCVDALRMLIYYRCIRLPVDHFFLLFFLFFFFFFFFLFLSLSFVVC